MQGRKIDNETIERVKTLYKQGLNLKEISILVDLTPQSINNIVRPFILSGEIKARRPGKIGKSPTPRGQGKHQTYVKKGYNPVNKKLTPEREKELLTDYFVNNMTYKAIMEKYGLWQASIKIIVDRAVKQGLYSPKGRGNNYPKQKQKGENKND